MQNQQKMGIVFLLLLGLSVMSISTSGNARQILLPAQPRALPPPTRGEQGARDDYQRKRQVIDHHLNKNKPIAPTPSAIRDKKLLEESLAPTPLDIGFTISLLYNGIKTSGGQRSDYAADPGIHTGLFYKPQTSRDSSKVNLWLGMRGYFVSGTGNYKGTRGSYSFSYYGPSIGLGKFDPAPVSVGQDTVKDRESIANAIISRHGYFAWFGVAAQTRYSRRETGGANPDDDLDNEPIAFDSPGIWGELWYANLRYNAISIHGLVGAQAGAGKLFYYIGIGAGGWR